MKKLWQQFWQQLCQGKYEELMATIMATILQVAGKKLLLKSASLPLSWRLPLLLPLPSMQYPITNLLEKISPICQRIFHKVVKVYFKNILSICKRIFHKFVRVYFKNIRSICKKIFHNFVKESNHQFVKEYFTNTSYI